MRELKFKLSDPTLTSDVNQTLSTLLSQTNKTNKNLTIVNNRVTNLSKTINQGGGGGKCCTGMGDGGSFISLPAQTLTTVSGAPIFVVDTTTGFIPNKSGAIEFQGTMSLDYTPDINAAGFLRFGLGSSTPWDGTNGNQYIGFMLVKVAGSLLANWQCIMYDGVSASQQIDSGVLAVEGESAQFGISVNALGTEVVFSINGSMVATMTTHLPTILLYLEISVQPGSGDLIAATGGLEAAGGTASTEVLTVQLDAEITRAKAAEAALQGEISTITITETELVLADVTTDNVSITKHGFAPKAPNDATKFLNGTGAYTVPAPATTLAADTDVALTSLGNGQILTYDSTASKWKNTTPSGGGTLAGDTDVDLTTPANGDVLTYESASSLWKNKPAGGGGGTILGPASVHDCTIWCKGDYITGLSDGDPVKSWKNAIEGGPAMTFRAAVTPPVYKTGILNSLPIVRFAAAGGLRCFMPNIALGGESTILLVLKMGNLTPGYTGIVTSALGGWGFYVKSNGKTAFYANGANYDGSGAYSYGTSVFQIVTLVYGPIGLLTRAALATDFSDTTTSGFQNVGSSAQGVFAVGDDETTGSRVLTGDIAEFLAYPRALNSTEYAAVESYLQSKYGL